MCKLRNTVFVQMLAVLAAWLLATVVYCAPTTLPTTQPDYLRGWKDAGGQVEKPAPSVPSPVYVDVVTALKNAKPDTTIDLAPGVVTIPTAVYAISVPVHLVGHNTTIRFTRTPGTTTGIRISADAELEGIAFTSDKPMATAGKEKVGINAIVITAGHPTIHDCAFSDVDDAVFFASTGAGTLARCVNTDNTIRGDFIFISGAQHIRIEGCRNQNSTKEHGGVRISEDPVGNNTAGDIVIDGCDFGNGNGKESIAVRGAGGGKVRIVNSDLRAWSRAGQVAPDGTPAPVKTVVDLEYENCRFYNRAYLALCQGVTANLKNLTFQNYAGYVPISVQGPHVNIAGDGVSLIDMGTAGVDHDIVKSYGLAPGDSVQVKGK